MIGRWLIVALVVTAFMACVAIEEPTEATTRQPVVGSLGPVACGLHLLGVSDRLLFDGSEELQMLEPSNDPVELCPSWVR